jgi:hypothetical protein
VEGRGEAAEEREVDVVSLVDGCGCTDECVDDDRSSGCCMLDV